MKKNDRQELVELVAALIAFPTIMAGVTWAGLGVLKFFGVSTRIAVKPYVDSDGDQISSSFTAPGYSALLFGISIAVYCFLVWAYPKPKGWLSASSISLLGLALAWIALATTGFLLDYVFGYKEGFQQIIATVLWLVLCGLWFFAVCLIFNWLHRFLTLDS